MSGEDDIFAGVDALLAAVNAGTVLPVPAERVRLRLAAGLTAAHIAAALRVDPALIQSWEDGSAAPAPSLAQAYGRLLQGLAERFPAPTQPAITSPPPTWPAPQVGVEVADRGPDGEVLMADPQPCRWCGKPTPIRVQGVPQWKLLLRCIREESSACIAWARSEGA